MDGTHIKANANLKKQVKKAIPVAAKRYQEQLDEEIQADRAVHGKKPLKKDDDDDRPSAPGKQKKVAESTADPGKVECSTRESTRNVLRTRCIPHATDAVIY